MFEGSDTPRAEDCRTSSHDVLLSRSGVGGNAPLECWCMYNREGRAVRQAEGCTALRASPAHTSSAGPGEGARTAALETPFEEARFFHSSGGSPAARRRFMPSPPAHKQLSGRPRQMW